MERQDCDSAVHVTRTGSCAQQVNSIHGLRERRDSYRIAVCHLERVLIRLQPGMRRVRTAEGRIVPRSNLLHAHMEGFILSEHIVL